MSKEAVDLVEKLLQLNPLMRLGSGPEDSDINFQALKDHKFFKDINFDKIKEGMTTPPIPKTWFKNGKTVDVDEDDMTEDSEANFSEYVVLP